MTRNQLFVVSAAITLLILTAALYWLTLEEADPCAAPQADISAALLAEGGDGDALANRAILMRGACDENADP